MDEMELRLLSQRLQEIEFRIKTLEQAVLQIGERVAKMETFYQRGANRLLGEIFETTKKDRKQ